MAAEDPNLSSDPTVQQAQKKYLANEDYIKSLSRELVQLQEDQSNAQKLWRKLSGATGVLETIFLGRLGNIKTAQEAKNKYNDLTNQISSKTNEINSAVTQRVVLEKAIQTAQDNADKARASAGLLAITKSQADALVNPEIVKAKAELEAIASRNKVVIIIVVALVLITIGVGFYFLKIKNKV